MPHPPVTTLRFEEVTRIGRTWAFTTVNTTPDNRTTRTRYRTDTDGRGLYRLVSTTPAVWEPVAWCPPGHKLPRRRDHLDGALSSLFEGKRTP